MRVKDCRVRLGSASGQSAGLVGGAGGGSRSALPCLPVAAATS